VFSPERASVHHGVNNDIKPRIDAGKRSNETLFSASRSNWKQKPTYLKRLQQQYLSCKTLGVVLLG
jgi:hypothetical protein